MTISTSGWKDDKRIQDEKIEKLENDGNDGNDGNMKGG
jgi:hypothetical protein